MGPEDTAKRSARLVELIAENLARAGPDSPILREPRSQFEYVDGHVFLTCGRTCSSSASAAS